MEHSKAEWGNIDLLRIFLASELVSLKTFADIGRTATREGRTHDAESANARWLRIVAGVKELLSGLPPDEQLRTEQQLAALELEFTRPVYGSSVRPNVEINIDLKRIKRA